MQPDDAADVRRLMAYEERTAGGLMTTEPIVLRPGRDRRRRPRPGPRRRTSPPRSPRRSTCAGRRTRRRPGKYLGTVHFQRLLRDPAVHAGQLDPRRRPAAAARRTTTLPQVARFFATYDMVAAPVVDEGGSLLGAVTVDDVLDHMLPDDWRETEFHQERGGDADGHRLDRERRRPRRAAAPRPASASTSRGRRAASCCPSTTPRRSDGSRSGSRGSWAPAGSSSG